MELPDNDALGAVKDLAALLKESKDSAKWVAISIFAGVARTVVAEDKRNIASFFVGGITAGFVGYMAHLGLSDSDISDSTVSVIIGIAAFSAADILKGFLKILADVGEDPHKAIRDIFNTWKLRK